MDFGACVGRKLILLKRGFEADVRGFRAWPRPCTCGRRAVPLTLFLRQLRCRRLVPAPSPLRVREVWRFFPPAPRPQGGGREERLDSRLFIGLGFFGFSFEDLDGGLVDGKAFVGEQRDSTSDSGDPKGKGFGVFEKLVEILGA